MGVMEKDRREQSEQQSDWVEFFIYVNVGIMILVIVFAFLQENISYGIKTS